MNRFFRFAELQTTPRTEVLAGVTTFLTMAYIIFVQPAVLSGVMFGFDSGMDFGALTVTVCLAAALGSGLMGLLARYPVALAPGMGGNFFFILTLVPAVAATGVAEAPWRVALGVIFYSGLIFLLITVLGIRRWILDAISPSMKNAIAVGIGLFIAFIGLQNTGLIVTAASAAVTPAGDPFVIPGTLVRLNPNLASPDLIVFFIGLMLIVGFHAWRVYGSIFWGILGATLAAVVIKLLVGLEPFAGLDVVQNSMLVERFELADRLVARPPSIAPVFLKMDLVRSLTWAMVPFIVMFLFMDLFDTMGTLIAVTQEAGLMKDNQLPRANQAFLADAVGTLGGACLGHSTVTSYIESAAGVEVGGRSGLVPLVTAACFLLAIFFTPVIAMVGGYAPITAPALVFVGAMMLKNIVHVNWKDPSELIPSFLIILGIPLSYSIADGIALGFIAYPVAKLLSGRPREAGWLMWALAVLLVFYFVNLRAGI